MRDYALLRGHLLSDLGFEGATPNVFSSDLTEGDAYRKAIADSFYKKLCPKGNSKAADAAALKKFIAINESIPSTPYEFPAKNEAESCFWDYFKNNLNTTLGWVLVDQPTDSLPFRERDSDSATPKGVHNYDLDYIRTHMGIGPGAAQKADSATLATKLFSGEMSYCTSEYLITLYRSALSETGLWADAEMHRFREFGFTRVEGGKIFFAKKNSEISRTCCTEANLNMLIQKSLGNFCEERLEQHFGISLSTQPAFNAELARQGSIDGSFGTIDLVSASDSIALRLFDAALEEGFTKAVFLMSRSESAVLPDGRKVGLRMISTMGNGFTFPLQTVIFACAVRSVYQLMGYPCADPRRHFGVFGDDIVVRRETFEFLSRMLEYLGFEVNVGKSFNNGPFRESCGKDYFRGINIRGVYVRSLETVSEVCSLINRLTRWSARSGIWLPKTLSLLLQWVGRPRGLLVPPSESDDAGIHVPFRLTKPKVTNDYWFSYRAFRRRSRKLVMPEPDDSANPPGYAVSFLSGHSRRPDVVNRFFLSPSGEWKAEVPFGTSIVRVSLRDPPDASPRLKVVRCAIPFWDWHGARDEVTLVSHRAWESMMLANFII